MYKGKHITFKGNKDGISIYLNSYADYPKLKEQLIKKLDSARQFFLGANVVSIQGRMLTEEEESEIKEIMHCQYGMKIIEPTEKMMEAKKQENVVFDGIEEGLSKFIKTTLRSGQQVSYRGNVIIIGDVNPGAEIIADGNILVMGTLRGMAHAGANGNSEAFVAAYSLQPTQLRIANIIVRSPDNEKVRPVAPEIASVKDGTVVIEPYLPNK